MRRSFSAAVLAVLAFAGTAEGQTDERPATGFSRSFTMVPRGGFIAFDKASGIGNAAALGLDATYNILPALGVGLSATFSRPVTRGNDFIGAIYLGDTTFLYRAEQPITVADLNLSAVGRLPVMGRVSPYVTGGVGGYTLYLDPEVSGRDNRVQRMSASVGAGVGVQISERLGMTFDVRDMIFMNYDRERLNPIRPQARLTRFREDFATPPEAKTTVHNIALQIGFSFVPSSVRDEEGGR